MIQTRTQAPFDNEADLPIAYLNEDFREIASIWEITQNKNINCTRSKMQMKLKRLFQENAKFLTKK